MAKKNTRISPALIQGLPIKNFQAFIKKLATQIGDAIGNRGLDHVIRDGAAKQTCYIKTYTPVEIQGQEKKLTALPLFTGKDQHAWLVVELDFEQHGREHYLAHVSLKLYAGPTTDATQLYFRAEWDPRSNPEQHAQPHWNIHDITWKSPIAGESQRFEEFAEEKDPGFLALVEETAAPKKAKDTDLLSQMKKFHFAMASAWHETEGRNTHARTAADEKTMINWVSSCARYIKHQIQHVGI